MLILLTATFAAISVATFLADLKSDNREGTPRRLIVGGTSALLAGVFAILAWTLPAD